MSDLVERLRTGTYYGTWDLMNEAADEIERLRKDAERLDAIRRRLEWDGYGYWFPDNCVKERGLGEEFTREPTIDEFRAFIDAAMQKKEGA